MTRFAAAVPFRRFTFKKIALRCFSGHGT